MKRVAAQYSFNGKEQAFHDAMFDDGLMRVFGACGVKTASGA